DIDHFKSVNDTFGHAVGDDAIRFVAGVVSEGTRGYDIVCRYGGEEFCVLLPGAALDVAAQVSERIRKSVMEQSLVNLPQLQGRGLTISLGIALFDGSMGQPMELVNRADEALYSSKTSGRNRTSICDPKHSATQAVA
ncbi:MAG: GGDEF domain-containing protein, partial [Gammaproteobacteria bacterium]|nr:GGDEF domain-containing protein [Gammaproteobacteria bacterium]